MWQSRRVSGTRLERLKSHDAKACSPMTTTKIEWTDATWNPVAGCSVVSAGCTHCYAMNMARRLESMGTRKYVGLTRITGNRAVWNGTVREDHESLRTPYAWAKPRKIFVNSMSDLFHEKVSVEFVLAVWQVMRETPRHHYQILTKRPEIMASLVSEHVGETLPNVWLGTSVEDDGAVHRIAHLKRTPAAVRFISFEPLIGSVGTVDLEGIDWAIVGGESGRDARPIKECWIDQIHDQARRYGTAFFFKQWGTWGADNKRRSKKANGREYRGTTWDEMPYAATHAHTLQSTSA